MRPFKIFKVMLFWSGFFKQLLSEKEWPSKEKLSEKEQNCALIGLYAKKLLVQLNLTLISKSDFYYDESLKEIFRCRTFQLYWKIPFRFSIRVDFFWFWKKAESVKPNVWFVTTNDKAKPLIKEKLSPEDSLKPWYKILLGFCSVLCS